ncbi:MAG: hypothetical protein A2X61_02940 [Ignavibacteria bacterium GWB2_35_12]|nr:MAG: hypothetical protein A2X63_11615 [Ignavibacteria bacterium GWA2_35_8]OGU38248.1 MAG: hypothetical protein A2X61_02940 [Ignavibacteria bacterium GWB2_35_12]OGU95469.1 MAG: hypothetical protein A2220_07115 [Ignavibacteria bacterium RIFOXYA2_FULL_35_10]OGV20815.1 MAG: hypothetical protein A2475_11610 [Ignavibacteria bacterium RIFOXYC2_FULL_35_21]
MKKPSVYLDTSIINFLYADDSPAYRDITIQFFNDYIDDYDIYISNIVFEEINKTKDLIKKEKLLIAINERKFFRLQIDDEVYRLANKYIEDKILPPQSINDARHIAVVTINKIDILLSWNIKHIANFKKQIQVRLVNEKEGYFYPITLLNPSNLIGEKDNGK